MIADRTRPQQLLWRGIVILLVGSTLLSLWMLAQAIRFNAAGAPSPVALWPLPGTLFVVVILAIAVGWAGIWQLQRGSPTVGSHLLWLSAAVVCGAGLASLLSIGFVLLPTGLLFGAAAVASDWGSWQRLLTHGVLFVTVATGAGLGIPLLDDLHLPGTAVTPVLETTPAPNAVDVPPRTDVVVRLPSTAGTASGRTYGMDVSYIDAGFLWLRPKPAGRYSGRTSTTGASRLTFSPADGFDFCRTVQVSVEVDGYRPYRFTFRTTCPQ